MTTRSFTNGALMTALLFAGSLMAQPAQAEPQMHMQSLLWGGQAEQLEYRHGSETGILAWDAEAFAGGDELKAVWRSEAEYAVDEHSFETLENHLLLQTPVSDFFDAVAGVRFDTPDGPNRVYGVLGLHGLAPQWFGIDLDLYLAERPAIRFESDYEALITNRIILTPSVEIDLPLADDSAIGHGAFAPKLELGARLSYDLVDRAVSPSIGVHYEQLFGQTGRMARADGEDDAAVRFVIGTRIMF